MASRVPNVDVLFKASSVGYETKISTEKHDWREHGCLSRRELVEWIFTYVKGTEDQRTQVRIYSRGTENKAYVVGRRTVARIVAGTLSVDDMCIGELASFLETQMRHAVSRLIPTREIPGTKLIECAHCGRGAEMVEFKGKVPLLTPLSTHHLACGRCGYSTYLVLDKFRGLCTDLVETARQNPSVERFYVNQPWNPNPPWLSRVDLFQMLKES